MQTKPQEWKEKKDTTTKETEFLNRFLVFRVQLVSHFLLLWRFLEDFLTTTDFSVPLRGISSMINCNGYFTTFNHETTQEASQSTECFPLSLSLSHARTALSLSLSLTHTRTHTHSHTHSSIRKSLLEKSNWFGGQGFSSPHPTKTDLQMEQL